MTSRDFQDRLSRRARRAGVSLTADLAAQLEVYYRLLAAWNTKINLTGLKLSELSPDTLDRLLVEPLVAAKYAPPKAGRMLDVGSGGGSPAIPFTLAIPRVRLLMVESKTRKSVFLREAVRELRLQHAEVVTGRFEELLARPELHEIHDLVTVRAVRTEPKMLLTLQALMKPWALLFLFKGSGPSDPSETVMAPLAWKATYPLIETLRSRLVVLEKRTFGPVVSRGTAL